MKSAIHYVKMAVAISAAAMVLAPSAGAFSWGSNSPGTTSWSWGASQYKAPLKSEHPVCPDCK